MNGCGVQIKMIDYREYDLRSENCSSDKIGRSSDTWLRALPWGRMLERCSPFFKSIGAGSGTGVLVPAQWQWEAAEPNCN
jgi:hypothetical protein